MTVAELIEKLKALPQDADVFINWDSELFPPNPELIEDTGSVIL